MREEHDPEFPEKYAKKVFIIILIGTALYTTASVFIQFLPLK